jgi:pimeloyl-ACP methyl ester carboxylesterase
VREESSLAGGLAGWTDGSGPKVLLLHGGPGLSYCYLDGLAADRAAFEAELVARTPNGARERAHALDERAMAGEGTAEESLAWGLAARLTVELSDRAFLDLVPSAGHLIWLAAPGRVLAALQRLHGGVT